MKRLQGALVKINYIGSILGSISLVGVMLVIVGNITFRLFGGVIQGSNEFIQLTQAVVVSAAIVYATVQNRHTVVDFILERFSSRTRAGLSVFTSLVGLLLWALVAFTGCQYAYEMLTSGEMSETLEIPYFPFRMIWVLAAVLICLMLISNLCDSYKKVLRR